MKLIFSVKKLDLLLLTLLATTCLMAQDNSEPKANPRVQRIVESDSADHSSYEKKVERRRKQSIERRKAKEEARIKASEVEAPRYIAIQAKAYNDSIVLRWAPNHRKLWLDGMKMGYTIVRHTFSGPELDIDSLRENNIRLKPEDVQPPTAEPLTSFENPIKPYDSLKWSKAFPTDDNYVLIAAGATVGALEVSKDAGFIAKGKQDESIFGLVLISADFSALAADGLGLRYVDRNVEQGKRYLYSIMLADSLSRVPIEELDSTAQQRRVEKILQEDASDVFVRYDEPEASKTVKNVKTLSEENQVFLQWPVPGNVFSGYVIERSSDGGITFDSLTVTPMLPQPYEKIDSTGIQRYYQYKDSVSQNYQPYLYRITGIDAFADRSIPILVSGMGADKSAPKNPVIKSGEYIEETGDIRLSWRLPEIPDDFADLHVEFNYHPDSAFVRLEAESIDPRDTVYHYTPLPDEYSHYFRMALLDTAGNSSYSFPIFVNIPDTIPPPVPTEVHAEIDSTGEVEIKWTDEHVDELGFLGYRVYYSNSLKHEFTQITTKPIISNFYIYHIPLNTLTEKIYYKVQAVDNSYNHSEFSEIAEAIKPDTLRPVTPVFKNIRATERSLELSWTPSSSHDVVGQRLIRKNGEETIEIAIENPTLSTYSDTTVQKGIIYEYRLLAIDDNQLRSELSFPLRGKRIDKKRMNSVSSLSASYDKGLQEVTLNWNYDETEGDYRFMIYRNKDSEKVKNYKSVDYSSTKFSETVKQSGTYYYAVKVIHKNGSKSQLSNPIKIKVK
ncbi:MAG: hypothetical protein ABJE80_12505 [Reichenbachiella sp.]